MIACIAVIGRANNPIYIRSFQPQAEELSLHFTAFCALDTIEERLQIKPKEGIFDPFLGFLFPLEDYKVYGYITNTNIKIIVILNEYTEIKEQELKTLFERLHTAYINAICNPFYNFDEPIESQTFDVEVAAAVASASH
eukprot:TRINITY_DN3631_c3_g1_i2.p1 TRINITY_DN3631_c3_g1~~TRINITY_DN3631_c3_g1_i2.p1  ORF type:complete len:139 (+),score=65.48 TRINITY_DN3631_c3_g1_i2:115-531(+)